MGISQDTAMEKSVAVFSRPYPTSPPVTLSVIMAVRGLKKDEIYGTVIN